VVLLPIHNVCQISRVETPQTRRSLDHPAQVGLFFIERDLMTRRAGQSGGFHTANASANDEDFPWFEGLFHRLEFDRSDVGIDRTLDLTLVEEVGGAMIAEDALPNLFSPTAEEFSSSVRVGQGRSSHKYCIDSFILNPSRRKQGVTHLPSTDNRYAHLFFHLFRVLNQIPSRIVERGNLVVTGFENSRCDLEIV